LDADLNISSITDDATGEITINWVTAFATANYVVSAMSRHTGAGATLVIAFERTDAAKTVSLVRLGFKNLAGTLTAPTGWAAIAIGNQ
jgi:hypothetical protein